MTSVAAAQTRVALVAREIRMGGLWEVSPAPQRQFYQHGETVVDGSFGGDRARSRHLTTVSRRAALVRPV